MALLAATLTSAHANDAPKDARNGGDLQLLPPVRVGPNQADSLQRNAADVTPNRLAAYPASLAPQQRHVWLDRLIADIEAKRAPPLTEVELTAALALVRSEADPRVGGRIWYLLAHNPRDDEAVALARVVVRDPEGHARWAAFEYLRTVNRPASEALVREAVPRPDSELLFFMADLVQESDAHRALAIMIAAPDLETDHWLFDQVTEALARDGSTQELAELKRRADAAGGRNVYRVLADWLSVELQKRQPARH
jgi:hypothetical protein